MSLRTFHLVFIVTAIILADMFAAWAIWDYERHQDRLLIVMGVASLVASFGLIVYAIRLVAKFDKANIH